MNHTLVNEFVDRLNRHSSLDLSWGASEEEQAALRAAVEEWKNGDPIAAHEGLWKEQISSGGVVFERAGESCSGFDQYLVTDIGADERGYLEAKPGPHASIVAERGKAEGRQ
jgi:hypothetical protein